jgi:hypothetical protein
MDCSAALAMTAKWPGAHRCHPREGGDPIRRGLTVQSLTCRITGPPPSRRTTTEYEAAFSRHVLPEVLPDNFRPLRSEGAGKTVGRPREDRVRAAPAVSCGIMRMARGAHEHTGSAGASRPSLRMALRPTSCSPRRTALLPPSPFGTLSHLKDLTPAPRRQNHTTSPYASATLVSHGIRVHRILPRVSDDGQRPSSRGETKGVLPLIWGKTEAEYF